MSNSRVVLVTGASRGIGLEVALQFARSGARIAMLSKDSEELARAASQIESLTEVMLLSTDISHQSKVASSVRQVLEKWGRIDVVVSNAGSLVYGSVEDCVVEDFENQISVNYLGAVYLTKSVLPVMLSQGNGSLIYVSSISGVIYLPNNSAYQASKAALRAFVLSLRRELVGSGIRVSLISPGRTKTEIAHKAVVRTSAKGNPILREMPVNRVAKVIVRCTEHPSREVIMPLAMRVLRVVYFLSPDVVETWLIWLQVKYTNMKPHRTKNSQGS